MITLLFIFQVYIAEIIIDPNRCASRNVHSRSLEEVKRLNSKWEITPDYMIQLDLTEYLKIVKVKNKELEEKSLTNIIVEDKEKCILI